VAQPPSNGRLPLVYVVQQLVADRWLSPADSERVFAISDRERFGHPISVLAEMNFRTPDAQRRLLDLELLTQWLADKVKLPYQHIDPLRVDFTRVVDVMSSAYATGQSILPIAVKASEIVVATCEPYLDGWVREIEQISKKTVLRVVANPVDIARYTTEFYKLAQQVKGATKAGTTNPLSNFEQLVELGSKVEANDQHVIHIVDWILQYAFDQRASDIHLEPKREQGVVRFRIDGVLHQVYQVPPGVMHAMTSRIKLLGRMDVLLETYSYIDFRRRCHVIRAWLLAATRMQTPPNNWMLFPVVISVILARMDPEGTSQELRQRALTTFQSYRQYYLDYGWFYDRPHGVDFYNTWSITYDLFWVHAVDPTFEPDFIVAAIEKSADLTQHLISPGGIPIMGRSICYRTAVPVPLLAATLLDSSKFPVGRAVRSLDIVWRYFVANDSLRDGALTQGYFKADPRLLDQYSGTGSCHWGLRSLVLAFMHPAGDRFWSAPQEPLPVEESDYRLELSKLGWTVEGRRNSGEIIITIPRNPADVTVIDEYSWTMRARETFLRVPLRPSNHEIKYESRHYSSASPFPLTD